MSLIKTLTEYVMERALVGKDDTNESEKETHLRYVIETDNLGSIYLFVLYLKKGRYSNHYRRK